MLNTLFFITPFVFFLLAVIFPLCITEKIPNWLTVNIGRLNADDIRKLESRKRNHLRNKIVFYFITAVIITLLISLAFVFVGNADNVLLSIPCNIIGLVVGLIIVFRILKTANMLKDEIRISTT